MTKGESTAIEPYRTSSPTSPEPRPTHGVLHGPEEEPQAKTHRCDTPGRWRRWRTGVRPGSLWRCSCGKVYRWARLYSGSDNEYLGCWWNSYGPNQEELLAQWLAAGGAP